jgi:hypothetical protein
MRLFKELKIFLAILLLIALLSGCESDDKITNDKSLEIYTELFISRFYPTQGGALVITDIISASFDSVYSPLTPNKPCSSINVSCNSFDLQWQDGAKQHIYTELGDLGFLNLGDIYVFKVDSGQAVPAFEKSIRFPSVQPLIGYPRMYPPPTLADSVSIASGFTITWGGTSSGKVELIICDGLDLGFQPSDSLFHIITENDGALSVTPDDLARVIPGETYEIILILKSSESIISEGYDPRSHITALTYTISHFYAL